MIGTYALIRQLGADQLDPDHAAPEIALRMEYSSFCQAWLSHLSPEDGERLLKLYGLNSEYDDVKPHESEQRHCGGCGSDIEALSGARQVVCESCGFTIDVAGMAVPCQKCGASLSFPVGTNHVLCPYCSTDTLACRCNSRSFKDCGGQGRIFDSQGLQHNRINVLAIRFKMS